MTEEEKQDNGAAVCMCDDCASLTWLAHYRKGRGFGYPRCCCARWTLDRLLGRSPANRGLVLVDIDGGSQYVPCGIFHHRDVTLEAFDRIERSTRRRLIRVFSFGDAASERALAAYADLKGEAVGDVSGGDDAN